MANLGLWCNEVKGGVVQAYNTHNVARLRPRSKKWGQKPKSTPQKIELWKFHHSIRLKKASKGVGGGEGNRLADNYSENFSFPHVKNFKIVNKKNLVSEAIDSFSVCFLKALEAS